MSKIFSARRWVRAFEEAIVIEEQSETEAIAYTTTGNAYELDFENIECSCPDHQQNGRSCKHLRKWLAEKQGWV